MRCNHCLEKRDWFTVNLGGLNLDDGDEGGRVGKNRGEYGSDSLKPPILGEGRSSVAFLRCIAAGSSTMTKNGGVLLELAGKDRG